MTTPLRVGGLIPLTTIDFPGRLAAVVFLQGCPWRCTYCQNPGLLEADAPTRMTWDEVLGFLQRRRGLLDGVVFSGGEPTLQAGLADAIATVRALGFQVGLHTGGGYPERLAALLPQLDWVGFDVKAPWDTYQAVTGVPGSAAKVQASLAHLLASGVAHEIRTTWHEGLFAASRLPAMAEDLASRGAARWSLQRCRVNGQERQPPPAEVMAQVQALFARTGREEPCERGEMSGAGSETRAAGSETSAAAGMG
jgi:pyruvate formate lyase activating enzyme